jgi:hypothetical protein
VNVTKNNNINDKNDNDNNNYNDNDNINSIQPAPSNVSSTWSDACRFFRFSATARPWLCMLAVRTSLSMMPELFLRCPLLALLRMKASTSFCEERRPRPGRLCTDFVMVFSGE